MTCSSNSRKRHFEMRSVSAALCAMVLLTLAASAQSKVPAVVIAPVPLVTAPRAAQTMVNLDFRVPSGYHINSNTPKSEFLIPTALKMDLPPTSFWEKLNIPRAMIWLFRFLPKKS
jgi:hypothetical protein